MKSNEELAKKYFSFFDNENKEIKQEQTKSIETIKPIKSQREFKPIMTTEEFDKIFGDME